MYHFVVNQFNLNQCATIDCKISIFKYQLPVPHAHRECGILYTQCPNPQHKQIIMSGHYAKWVPDFGNIYKKTFTNDISDLYTGRTNF